jgi:hypothetical protein
VEIFTRDKKSYFFNLLKEDQCQLFLSKVGEVVRRHQKLPSSHGHRKIEIVENPKNEFKKKRFLEDWEKGEKST